MGLSKVIGKTGKLMGNCKSAGHVLPVGVREPRGTCSSFGPDGPLGVTYVRRKKQLISGKKKHVFWEEL